MKYFYRTLFDEIIKWIGRREIIAIKGPRQAGKTTLLSMLREWLENEKDVGGEHITYLTFEDRELLDSFASNPKEFVERYLTDDGKHYLLIDEAQYCADLGQKLKLVYDLHENLKIIITGSSSLELTSQTGRFLVGRLLEFELMPLSFYEFLLVKDKSLAVQFMKEHIKIQRLFQKGAGFATKRNDIIAKELLRRFDEFVTFGGYPAVVKASGHEEKKMVLRGIVNTYIDRDIVSYLSITDTIKFRKLLTLLAASNGGIAKADTITVQLKGYFRETERLMNVLEQTYVINQLRPYHRNLVTELRKNPKVYFVDTGMRNYLSDEFGSLETRSDSGVLAENFVLNELRPYARLNFWRTTAKTEIDFIANKPVPIPVEVKFRHFDRERIGKNIYGFVGAYKPRYGLMITKDFWGEKSAGGARIKFVPIGYL